MDYIRKIVRRLIKEDFEGVGDKALNEKEVRLFKYLNKSKKTAKTRKQLLELLETLMPMINKPKSEAVLYYEVYSANYRPEGDYENLTKSEFKDFKSFKQRKTPNNNAYTYSSAKIPFKGSNLEGYWDVNESNEWYYVVKSYGWYPIYLFIKNQWYKVSRNYSSSTSKHLWGSHPLRTKTYDEEIKSDIIMVTPDEMKRLIDGNELADVETDRVKRFMSDVKSKLIGKKILRTFGWGEHRKKASFQIQDIKQEGDKINIYVTVTKAGKVEGTNKMVVDPMGYIYPSPFSDELDKGITEVVIGLEPEFLNKKNTEVIVRHNNKN